MSTRPQHLLLLLLINSLSQRDGQGFRGLVWLRLEGEREGEEERERGRRRGRERNLWFNVLLMPGGSGAKSLKNFSGFCATSSASLPVIKAMCSGEMRIYSPFTPERYRAGFKTSDAHRLPLPRFQKSGPQTPEVLPPSESLPPMLYCGPQPSPLKVLSSVWLLVRQVLLD